MQLEKKITTTPITAAKVLLRKGLKHKNKEINFC
jgi:hypothetical protein